MGGGGGDEDPIYLSSGKGLCRECGEIVPVRYQSRGGAVYLVRHCPEHGQGSALVAESLQWFHDVHSRPPGSTAPAFTVGKTGECPTSCGPCAMHGQRCHLPVLSITNACDLRCPICFTFNRSDRIWHIPPEEFSRQVDFVIRATGGVDLINLTGGEPTLHPELFDLLRRAKRPEIGRVTMNTNGLSIARDSDLARRLADEGVYVVLSLDTFSRETSNTLHGRDIVDQKRRALEHLEKFGVPTTLLMVLVGGVNEADLSAITDLALTADFVRSLTIQTMTYTGQGGGGFGPRKHIPVDGVERRIEEATGGRVGRRHFIPLPTAHPLCYGVAYLLRDEAGAIVPLTELISPDDFAAHLTDGYLLHPSVALEAGIREAIDRLFSTGEAPETLALLKHLLTDLYPTGQALTVAERQRRAERAVKTIYVHAHMDEDTFETSRVMRCPDQVPVTGERLVSACNYNLFHRKSDERFWVFE